MKLTQGSIISNIKNPFGAGLGIIITAKCDIEHDKAPLVNIIPLLEIPTWIKHYGHSTLYRLSKKDAENDMKSILNTLKLPETGFKDFSIETLCENLNTHDRKALTEAVGKYKSLNEQNSWNSSIKSVKDKKKELINLISSFRLPGTYLLSTEKTTLDKNYIADLRCPISIPLKAISSLSRKIDIIRYQRDELIQNYFSSPEDGEIIRKVSEIPSPDIEHFMQIFTLTFSRIGIDDIQKSMLKQVEKELSNG